VLLGFSTIFEEKRIWFIMRVVGGLILMAVAALASACLEMPITRLSKTDNPVVVPDAGEDGGPDPQAICAACMAAAEDPGPGCKIPYDACMVQPKCALMIQCAFDDRCFLGPRRAFLGCGLTCLTKAGVETSDDKVLTQASSLFQCLANGPCGDLCFSGD
jgi:hypothetical protein